MTRPRDQLYARCRFRLLRSIPRLLATRDPEWGDRLRRRLHTLSPEDRQLLACLSQPTITEWVLARQLDISLGRLRLHINRIYRHLASALEDRP